MSAVSCLHTAGLTGIRPLPGQIEQNRNLSFLRSSINKRFALTDKYNANILITDKNNSRSAGCRILLQALRFHDT
jgi:hypothetical protein